MTPAQAASLLELLADLYRVASTPPPPPPTPKDEDEPLDVRAK